VSGASSKRAATAGSGDAAVGGSDYTGGPNPLSLDFTVPLPNLDDFGVAVVASDGRLVPGPGATKDLGGASCRGDSHLGGEPLDDPRPPV
jgi:hypothetical protein